MRHWPPSSITTDQLGAYLKAISRLQSADISRPQARNVEPRDTRGVIQINAKLFHHLFQIAIS